MSVEKFQALLHRAEYRKNDKKFFPLWVRRYAESVQAQNGKLPVTVESVTAFSRSLRDHRIPAWQRLQAVRAVEAYRDLVLGTDEPSLTEMRRVLQRRAERKYPNECKEFGWQWVFPASQMSKDPRSGQRRRHHVSEDYFGKFFKRDE